MARGITLLLLLSVRTVAAFDKDGCTSIAVASGATTDGSAMTTHANDCSDCDWRMVYVPARDHPEGSLRTILDQSRSPYPRLVDTNRSKQYHAAAGIESSKVMGYIPQVRHTYALWEATYGLMNEKGLTIGESTCAGYLMGNATKGNPTEVKEHNIKDGALLVIGNLIALALERCETARCAIQTMADLSMKYGFYGEDPGPGGAGEALTIADMSGETWVFHILGGLPEREGAQFQGQRGALWAAQQVPRGHVAVIANNFIIREVDTEDAENFMVHPGLLELCQEAGLWDGKGKFDFLKITTPDMRTFEDPPGSGAIPMYTTMRMWHVFSKVAPSLGIDITDNTYEYPFSVPVDSKLSKEDVMNLFRSHYEGTPFDMRLGAMAGPFSSPNRAEGGMGMWEGVKGQIGRGISIHRTAYTQVGQTGIDHPKVWFGPDAAASSIFVPFYASVLAEGEGQFDEKTFGVGSMKELDFSAEVKPAWWAFDFVANWMDVSYLNMSETYVIPKVQTLQGHVSREVAAAEARAAKAPSAKHAALALAEEQSRIQRNVSQEWWKFAGMLVVRYNDQNYNFPDHSPDVSYALGYPAWWLEMVGFSQTSFLPNWVTPSKTIPSMLPLKDRASALSAQKSPQVQALCEQPWSLSTSEAAAEPVASGPALGWVSLAVCGHAILACGVVLGYQLGWRSAAKDEERHGYVAISA